MRTNNLVCGAFRGFGAGAGGGPLGQAPAPTGEPGVHEGVAVEIRILDDAAVRDTPRRDVGVGHVVGDRRPDLERQRAPGAAPAIGLV